MKPSLPKNKRTLTFYRYSMRRELKSKIEFITKDVRLALIARNLCPQGIFVTERTKTFIARLATLESMELQATEVRTIFGHVLIFFIKLIGTLFSYYNFFTGITYLLQELVVESGQTWIRRKLCDHVKITTCPKSKAKKETSILAKGAKERYVIFRKTQTQSIIICALFLDL